MFTSNNYTRLFFVLLTLVVLAGTLIAYITHPAMYLLSIALGIALVVVGMADGTGMGLFLARLPSTAELPVAARRLARQRR